MDHVLWLGGGCGSGKTTISWELAHRHDVQLYPVDAHGYEHLRRSGDALLQAGFDERWLRPTPGELAERFVSDSARRLSLILDDLAGLAGGPLVIAEGPQLFPALVAAHVTSPSHGLWLVPTEDFQGRMLAGRIEMTHTSDSERALRNRLGRDAILNRLIRRQAVELGFPVIDVDGSVGLSEMIEVVAGRFEERLAAGPRARDGAEHRRIRRVENVAVRDNLVAWREDAGVERMPDPPKYGFACECASVRGCRERVLLAAGEYEEVVRVRGALVAAGHESEGGEAAGLPSFERL
jgi:hypothetical protein